MNKSELKTFLEKRYRTEFWGKKYLVSPRLCETKFGDGKVFLGVQPLNNRPQYYIVRVDSTWVDSDMYCNSDIVIEHINEIEDAIEEEFGRAWYEDDPKQRKSGRKWPAANFDVGCRWFTIKLPNTEKRT